MFARLTALLARNWQTVAVAQRSCRFAGTAYPMRGEIDRRPVRVSYQIALQQDERGRRRYRVECPAEARGGVASDPIMSAVRAWKRGAGMPSNFHPLTA